jgi:2-keto-3-deoxy-L-rhamnonate aldolase RhmA
MIGIRERISRGEVLYGTFLGLGSALAAEACAIAGFDWLLADLEHGGGAEVALASQQMASVAHDVPMLVRVESADRIRTGRALDLGMSGVMFPRLDTADEVELAIRHLRYPPEGDRGVATSTRSCGFGLDPAALDTANDKVAGIVQIESLASLASSAEIARIPGVDVLFVGPRDLSHALGVPIQTSQTTSPEFIEAARTVVASADAAGIAAGILAADISGARAYAEMGFRFIGVGSDVSLLAKVGRDITIALAQPHDEVG